MATRKIPAKAENKSAPVKSNSQPATSSAAKEKHIADQIKALPKRRVWPD